MSREGIVDRTEPPERGQALAVYNAVTQWIEYVESEWQHLAPGETMSGSADETLDPILLDLCNETYITAPRQIYDWLRGEIKAIPASVAHRANQIVTAAYQSWTHAMAWTLRDQLHAIAEREGVQHVWTIVPRTIEPNDRAERAAVRLRHHRYVVPHRGSPLALAPVGEPGQRRVGCRPGVEQHRQHQRPVAAAHRALHRVECFLTDRLQRPARHHSISHRRLPLPPMVRHSQGRTRSALPPSMNCERTSAAPPPPSSVRHPPAR